MATTEASPLATPADPPDIATTALKLDALGFVVLLAAVVWAPWPLGSNRSWSLSLLAAMVWVGVVVAAAGALLRPRVRRLAATRWFIVPLAALVGFAGIAAVQLWPGLGAEGGTLSIDPARTRSYLLTTLLYLGAWLLVLLAVNTRERALRLLAALLAAGVLQAVVAVLLYASRARYDLWFQPFEQGGRAMGTFPNPDHLAGYMELTLSAGLGWLLAQLKGSSASPAASSVWQVRLIAGLNFMMSTKMLLRMVLVVLVIALVMTHSRMGNAAFFLSLALTGLLVAARSRRMRRPALWLVASMVLVDAIIIGQWVGLDRVVERLKDTAAASSETIGGFGLESVPPPREESLAKRLEVPILSLQLVEQRPWLGHGGGTYYTAFPPLKVPGLPWQWDHAHNDYVQVACDMGLVGLALWVSIGLATFWRGLQLLHDGESRVNRGLGVAGLMALSCLGLHSLVDFNLHIPANAMTFTVILAAVWASPATAQKTRRRKSARGAAAEQ